jgi:Flp pilus assembly protein TadG
LVEFATSAVMMILLLFGLIDFAVPIYYRLVMIDVSREGSNLAARGPGSTQDEAVSNALSAVMAASSPLLIMGKSTDMGQGRIYISAVVASSGVYRVTSQSTTGGLTTTYAPSKINNGTGRMTGKLPTTTPQIPSGNKTLYVTEVYYQYKPAAPLGKMVNFLITTQLYDAAYF